MEPMVIARLVQLAGPGRRERALVVGAGAGYGAAPSAACGVRVTAVEEDFGAAALAGRAADRLGPRGELVVGRLPGWKAGAPYDRVLIEGASAGDSPAIEAQLREGHSRGWSPFGCEPRAQAPPSLLSRRRSGLRARPIFECSTPALQSPTWRSPFSRSNMPIRGPVMRARPRLGDGCMAATTTTLTWMSASSGSFQQRGELAPRRRCPPAPMTPLISLPGSYFVTVDTPAAARSLTLSGAGVTLKVVIRPWRSGTSLSVTGPLGRNARSRTIWPATLGSPTSVSPSAVPPGPPAHSTAPWGTSRSPTT